MSEKHIEGIRNIFNFDLSQQNEGVKREFEHKEKQIMLIDKLSNLLQSRHYKYTLPDLMKFFRSVQCFCKRTWPGSIVEIPALKEEKLLQDCRLRRRGLDIKIKYANGYIRQKEWVIAGIAPWHEVDILSSEDVYL